MGMMIKWEKYRVTHQDGKNKQKFPRYLNFCIPLLVDAFVLSEGLWSSRLALAAGGAASMTAAVATATAGCVEAEVVGGGVLAALCGAKGTN